MSYPDLVIHAALGTLNNGHHRLLLGLVVLSLFSKQRQDMDRSTIFMFPYKICVIFANHDGEMAVEELAIDYVSELLSTIWP